MVLSLLSFIADVIGSAMTLYGAAYVIALSRPLFFHNTFASIVEPKAGLQKVVVYALFGLKIISIGKFFYHATYGIVDVIPADWMTYDEDGEPGLGTREYLQYFLAMFGTAFVLDSEGKVSREGARLLKERQDKYGY